MSRGPNRLVVLILTDNHSCFLIFVPSPAAATDGFSPPRSRKVTYFFQAETWLSQKIQRLHNLFQKFFRICAGCVPQ